MAQGVSLDELLDARERHNREKAKAGGQAASVQDAGLTEELTIPRLIGLWLLVTGLLLLKIAAALLMALAGAVEWLKKEHDGRQKKRRR